MWAKHVWCPGSPPQHKGECRAPSAHSTSQSHGRSGPVTPRRQRYRGRVRTRLRTQPQGGRRWHLCVTQHSLSGNPTAELPPSCLLPGRNPRAQLGLCLLEPGCSVNNRTAWALGMAEGLGRFHGERGCSGLSLTDARHQRMGPSGRPPCTTVTKRDGLQQGGHHPRPGCSARHWARVIPSTSQRAPGAPEAPLLARQLFSQRPHSNLTQSMSKKLITSTGMCLAVEYSPSRCEALGPTPSPTKKKGIKPVTNCGQHPRYNHVGRAPNQDEGFQAWRGLRVHATPRRLSSTHMPTRPCPSPHPSTSKNVPCPNTP